MRIIIFIHTCEDIIFILLGKEIIFESNFVPLTALQFVGVWLKHLWIFLEVFDNLKDTFCVSGQPCNILYALKRAFASNNKVEVIALSSKSLEFIYLFIYFRSWKVGGGWDWEGNNILYCFMFPLSYRNPKVLIKHMKLQSNEMALCVRVIVGYECL